MMQSTCVHFLKSGLREFGVSARACFILASKVTFHNLLPAPTHGSQS